MNKENLLISIVVIVAISGCTNNNIPIQPIVDPKPANDAIMRSQSFYQTIQLDLSNASTPINEAKLKGIDITNSNALVSSLQNKLSNAAYILSTALSEYQNQNYPQAKSHAEQSLAIMQEVQNQLSQIRQIVENDYKATAAKYKPRLMDAERQYKIGQRYIESVQKVGQKANIDVSNQQNHLQEIMANLNKAKESYRNNNFIGLSDQINSVISTSQQVQGELTDLYYNALIIDATNKAELQVTDQEAKNYLLDTNSLRQQKKYQNAVVSLNKALVIDNQVLVLDNVNKLKQSIRDMGLEASLRSIDDKLSSLRLHIANDKFDIVKQEIETVKTDTATTSEGIAKVADAGNVIEDTSKLNFWWAEKQDTSASNAKLVEAKRFLVQGDYASAADAASVAIDLAAFERRTFWNKVESNWILSKLLGITKLVKDPEKYELKPVERSQFRWKNLELIRIEFDKPIADVSNIIIEDSGTPIVPTITNAPIVAQKKPVSFELNPGTPTECGTTCRQTAATLTNSGDETAHNVRVDLNIYNNIGESVYSIQKSLGDIPGHTSKSETVTINADCGFLYSKCLSHKPLTLKSEVISDEGTFPFQDQQFS